MSQTLIQTRLPDSHGALSEHFNCESMSEEDICVVVSLMRDGVHVADLPVDTWKVLRRCSPGALAASVSAG